MQAIRFTTALTSAATAIVACVACRQDSKSPMVSTADQQVEIHASSQSTPLKAFLPAQPALSENDQAVLREMLIDLIIHDQEDGRTGRAAGFDDEHQRILLDMESLDLYRSPQFISDCPRYLNGAGLRANEAYENVTVRNRATVHFAGPSNDEHILLGSVENFGPSESLEARAFHWAKTGLPGYSADGSTALVVFSCGPTPHGADGFCVLRRTDNGWTVHARKIVYFM